MFIGIVVCRNRFTKTFLNIFKWKMSFAYVGIIAISNIFLIEMTFVNGHTQTWSVYINMLTGIVVF